MVVVCGSPFGGLQTEAGFASKLRPQSSQVRGPPPSLSAGFLHSGPCHPLRFGCHPASLPASQRRAGAGGGRQPCSRWERILWFWLYVCLGFFVCVCVFILSFGFKLGTGAHTLSGAESTSSWRAGSAVPRQAQPHFPFGASAHAPWLPPHLLPLASHRSHLRQVGGLGSAFV